MTTMTLRGIDDTMAAALKDKARQEEISVNAMLLRILKESLGIDKKRELLFIAIWTTWPVRGAHKRVKILFALRQYSSRLTRICGNRSAPDCHQHAEGPGKQLHGSYFSSVLR